MMVDILKVVEALSVTRPRGRSLVLIGIAIAASSTLALAGCAGPLTETSATQTKVEPKAAAPYTIGAQDVLEVTVFNLPELNRTVQVAATGVINFPLIGDVPATGKTAQDIEIDIAARLDKRFLRSPQVNVSVKEFNSQHVTVDGAVKKPGVFPLRDRTTLTEVIAIAGGLDSDLSSSDVILLRRTSEGTSTTHYNIDAIRGGTAQDPIVENGDAITIDTSGGKVVMNDIGKVSPVFNVFKVFP